MIIYKPGDWWKALWHFHTTKVLWVLLGRVALVGVYVAAVTVAQLQYFRFVFEVEREFFSFLGILLSLLLVFRTNTAYDRYYEGRRQWGQLIGACRNLAAILGGALPAAAAAHRIFYARMLSNFALALEGHLRENVQYEQLEEVAGVAPEGLRVADHLPTKLATLLQASYEQLHQAGELQAVHLLQLQPYHGTLLETAGACERIRATPIPFSYSFFIKGFITIFLLIMPFVLLDTYRYFTVPIVMIGAYALLGLELIGEEIENPFGLESNDLPLTQLANRIRVSVHEALGVALPVHKKALADLPYTIVH
ncbi:bestrophin family ion channel [Hymenobacter sp. YC55]|uniref:bestrophin family protein n=1 Tax=Hymenobacter sp. YC55 TaxID=3034019 RepID=UPI0023F95B91|nr:bestrophin family ion channel [Hymenobacter sp. YC55]MDF7815433.1 bestrophin family ion channel [Hymenobacter sp. YC55]